MGMRRILVTGGLGYVGGRVAQGLAKREGLSIALGSREEQPPPSWLPGAHVVGMNWRDAASLAAACEGMDAVLHFAAMNDSECAQDPVAALEVNGVNTVRLVEAAKRSGVKRFIYLSTAHIYGAPLAGRIDENTLPRSRHPYASSHRAAEDAVLAASSNLTSIVIRLSNGFGVPVHAGANCWKLLVNDLCRQAVTARRLTLRSAGLQQRDFVTLHDVARGMLHMLDMPSAVIADGIFNLGGGQAMRIIDMAEMVRARCTRVLGYMPDISRPEPIAGDEGGGLVYCIDKLLATGFTLSGSFEDEIDATLHLCREAFSGEVA